VFVVITVQFEQTSFEGAHFVGLIELQRQQHQKSHEMDNQRHILLVRIAVQSVLVHFR
jgi:hypothetical protein